MPGKTSIDCGAGAGVQFAGSLLLPTWNSKSAAVSDSTGSPAMSTMIPLMPLS